MSRLIGKITEKLRFYKQKTACANPEYTRTQWIIKCIQIGFGAFTIDFLGQKLAWYDFEVSYNRLTPAIVYSSTPYIFYLVVQGFFIALTFWRILEIFWWAKNQVNHTCDGSAISPHKHSVVCSKQDTTQRW